MSRFGDMYDSEEWFPNAGALWHANAERALAGKRGRKALRELREALLALPEKRLIASALCTVDREKHLATYAHGVRPYYAEELGNVVKAEGEGVCAIGAFLWHKRVKAGEDPEEVFASMPTMLDIEGGDLQTAEAGKREGGLTFTLAWTLAYRNDEEFGSMTPEQRYVAFLRWVDEQLASDEPVP